MSGIFDQVINYAPPSLLTGTVTYKGTWSAATNTPTLANPPAAITNGNYYVVSAGGTQFSLVFNIGDWIISNGSAWEKVDNTDAVDSVFGRTGAVVGVSTDYSAVGITNTALGASNPSTVAATTITASSTVAATGAVTGSNLSGTNTGDQTITLTGGVTGSGTGSFAATVVTNANLTGVITSSGNATSIASQTGTGTKFVVDTSPTLITPNIGVATGTSLAAALNGTLGATTPSSVAATTGTFSSTLGVTGVATLGNGAILGTPASGTVTNLTGTASININGTVGATTASTGAFTTVSSTSTTNLATAASVNVGIFNASPNSYLPGIAGVAIGPVANASVSLADTASTKYWTAYNNNGTLKWYLSAAAYSTSGATGDVLALSSTGLAVTGTLSATGSITTSAGSISALAGELQVGSAAKQLYLRTVSGVNRIDSYDNPITATVPLQINASTYTFQVADVTTGTLTSTGLNSIAIGATTASTGAFSTLSATGLLSFTGFGTNSLDASGTGAQTFRIRNSTAGTGNYSILQFGHSASVDTAGLVSTSTTYTASGAYPQNGTLLYGSQVGGLNLAATDGSGVIRFFAASGTATATINSAGAAITGTLSVTGAVTHNVAANTAAIETWNDGTDVSLIVNGKGDTYATVNLSPLDLGNGAAGRRLLLGRNSNATNKGSGHVYFGAQDGNFYAVWADTSGILRILANDAPTTANVTAGTVVGTQTSWHEAKNVLRASTVTPAAALAAWVGEEIADYTYRNGAYNGEQFTGLVGYKRDAWFLMNRAENQVPALNLANISGYTALAFRALETELQSLRKRLAALESK